MSTVSAYGVLRALKQPVIETRDAAAALDLTKSAASKVLRRAEQAGLVSRVRHGLWALDQSLTPAQLAGFLTAPYPAYISFWSALARYEMIQQIPASVHVASLARSQQLDTSFGRFEVHRIAPEVFAGFEGSPQSGYWASPEKALFDTVYVRTPRGGLVRLPELELPEGFDRRLLGEWAALIPHARLRTLVERNLEYVLKQAG